MIAGSVGSQGSNNTDDVLVIQNSLNVFRLRDGLHPIAVDGVVGAETIGAIVLFQQKNGLVHDGRVDPDRPSIAKIKELLGEEAEVFGPVLAQICPILGRIGELKGRSPDRARRYFNSVLARFSILRSYRDLTRGLEPKQPIDVGSLALNLPLRQRSPAIRQAIQLASFATRAPVIAFAGVDDVAELILLAMLAACLVAMLMIMVQSPAFAKAVQVRAKELARIIGELTNLSSKAFESAADLVVSITNDTVNEANQCRQSPTFTPTPECQEAMRNFKSLLDRIRRQLSEIARLIAVFNLGVGRGLSVHGLRTQIQGLLSRMQKNAVDVQVALADMKKKCNCPNI